MVVSGFPGVGKTHLKNMSPMRVIDSDSSKFSWSSPGVRNPEFPQNYIEHIKEVDKEGSLVLVSSHEIVRNALVDAKIDFTLVYPDKSLKQEYLGRFRNRGSDDAFVTFISDNWDKFIDDMSKQKGCRKITLLSGEYLANYFNIRTTAPQDSIMAGMILQSNDEHEREKLAHQKYLSSGDKNFEGDKN